MIATTKLQRIARLSKEEPERTFMNLMFLFNKEALKECFNMLDRKKAIGVDGRKKNDEGNHSGETIILTI